MVEWHDLISLPVDDVDGAVDVGHAINVGELVEGQCPSEIEYNTKRRHQSRMQDHTGHWVLLCQVARWSGADGAAVEDDVVRADVQVFGQVEVDSLDIVVKRPITRYAPITLTEPRVLIDDTVHIDLLQEVRLQPLLNQVDILSVSMRDHQSVLRVSVDEEDLELAATLTVQEEMVRVHGEARDGRLEKNL